jgi:hypothetical protein
MGSFDRYHRRSVWETYVAGGVAVAAFVLTVQGRSRPAIVLGVPALLLILRADQNWGRATVSLDNAIHAHNAAISHGSTRRLDRLRAQAP